MPVGEARASARRLHAGSSLRIEEKRAIAEAAARAVRPGASIGIGAGTTCYELAKAIRDVPDLTVVTNSLPVAQLLHQRANPRQELVITGGVGIRGDALGGAIAVAAVRSLRIDLLFLGADGVDVHAGLTTNDVVEAETNRAFVASARRTHALVDHSKLGVVGLSTFMSLSELNSLVTDDGLTSVTRAALTQVVCDLQVVSTREPAARGPAR